MLKHSTGDPEKDIPKVLYKYRNWNEEYHSKFLTHGELYFASPKQLNDSLDCRITERFASTPKKVMKKYKRDLIKYHGPYLAEIGIDSKQLENLVNEKSMNVNEFERNWKEKQFSMQDEYYGILSLSTKWNTLKMWSLYANNQTGFCVGIKGISLTKLPLKPGMAGKVLYQNKLPVLVPKASGAMSFLEGVSRFHEEVFFKKLKWRIENEYRIAQNYFPNQKPDRHEYLRQGDIVEVILGKNISADDKDDIYRIARICGIPVFQSKLKSGQLIRIKI